MKKFLFLCLTYLTSIAQADSISSLNSTTSDHMKLIQVEYKHVFLSDFFFLSANVGGLSTTNVLDFPKWVAVGGIGIGAEVKASYFIFSVSQGISVFHKKLSNPGTIWQLPTSVQVAVSNKKGMALGLVFTHYSNGKTDRTNQGYDFSGILLRRDF